MQSFDFENRTRVVFGEGSFERLGELARELKFNRTLVVADRGLVACGYVDQAIRLLAKERIEGFTFHDFDVNPDSAMIEAGRDVAAPLCIDSIVGLGGGSSLDCAKAINFLLTNGGVIQDYWGFGKATKPMLPMIGIPTTAGTGSEAQSYALISDVQTHVKMACGDPKAAFRISILDPRLTVSQPAPVTAIAGFDAISHAVETYVTTSRNPLSESFSREAWRLLESNYESVLANPRDIEARAAMQLGAFYSGVAIENSMLGAAHACANPLTAHYGTSHGEAIALMLPTVVRWNGADAGPRYAELLKVSTRILSGNDPNEAMALRLEQLIEAGGLPRSLRRIGIGLMDLPDLAQEAGAQWTGRFNPRPFGAAEALEVYKCAY
jgi:alcohol dehydrogenase class IV